VQRARLSARGPTGGGSRAAVDIQAGPQQSRLSGPPRAYPFRVVAQPGWDAPRAMDAQLVHKPLLPPFGPGWLVLLRMCLTPPGALLMVLGAFADWYPGVPGTDLTYENYVETVFSADAPSPPGNVDSIFVSVGLVPLVLAVFVLLGLASRRGLLTRLAAGVALLFAVAFAFTVGNQGVDAAAGVYLVIAGSVIALIGGICGMAGKR
jgi:hypothetical protein